MRAGTIGRARTFDIVHRRWLPEKLDPPNFALQLFHKDVKLGVELARQVGVPARLSQLVLEEMTEAMNRGWGGRDSQAYLCLQQERAGLPSFGVAIEDIEAVMKAS
jgi:3-hydroxyisobutyrate dehydrogenase-like beta-hydroxyacid dehydrogenase